MTEDSLPTVSGTGKIIGIALLCSFLAAAVVGAVVYSYERVQNNSKQNNLQSQINLLKVQVAILSSSPTPTSTTTPTPTVATTLALLPCTTNELSASLVAASGGGTAGTFYYQLSLTNKDTQSCTLYGFPGISLLDKSGGTLGEATRSGTASATVTLAPGKAAYVSLGFPDFAAFPSGKCTGPADSLKIYPPNQTISLSIPNIAQYGTQYTGQYCGSLTVSPVSATAE